MNDNDTLKKKAVPIFLRILVQLVVITQQNHTLPILEHEHQTFIILVHQILAFKIIIRQPVLRKPHTISEK